MFSGSIVALITPFTNNRIDENALRQLVKWHIEQGSHGLVPTGTTGESPTLSSAECRLPIVALSTQTKAAIRQAMQDLQLL